MTTHRVRLSHHVVRLDDGRRVGVSVGGSGVPLVFLHGLGLNGRAYVRLLSRLGGLGFTVIALDAAGHGGSPNLPRGAAALRDRVDLTIRTLDTLGVQQAVFLGHSMGGRMIVDLAARAPHRVLAAVLLNAAAGAPFDASLSQRRTPRAVARALLLAAVDATGDPRGLTGFELAGYGRLIGAAVTRNTPLGLTGALQAIMGSGEFGPKLAAMRRHRVPTIVVHSDGDRVVPFDNAVDMARRTGGALYRVPGAHHSWMLAHPRRAADMMSQLLHAELGTAVRRARGAALRPGSLVRELNDDRVNGLGDDDKVEPVHLERLRTAV